MNNIVELVLIGFGKVSKDIVRNVIFVIGMVDFYMDLMVVCFDVGMN